MSTGVKKDAARASVFLPELHAELMRLMSVKWTIHGMVADADDYRFNGVF